MKVNMIKKITIVTPNECLPMLVVAALTEQQCDQMAKPENTHHGGKHHFTGDLLFDWFGFVHSK